VLPVSVLVVRDFVHPLDLPERTCLESSHFNKFIYF